MFLKHSFFPNPLQDADEESQQERPHPVVTLHLAEEGSKRKAYAGVLQSLSVDLQSQQEALLKEGAKKGATENDPKNVRVATPGKTFRKSLSGPALSETQVRTQTSPSRRPRSQTGLEPTPESPLGQESSSTESHPQTTRSAGTSSGASIPSISESDGSTGSFFRPTPSSKCTSRFRTS
jgi:hypothetical protein